MVFPLRGRGGDLVVENFKVEQQAYTKKYGADARKMFADRVQEARGRTLTSTLHRADDILNFKKSHA